MDENVRNRVTPPHTQMYVYIYMVVYMQIEFPPFPTREKHPSDRGCFRRAIAEKYFASDVMEVASGQKVEIVELPPNWITLLYMLYPFVMVC